MNTSKKPMVDATGQFPDGDGFNDVVELQQRLLERQAQFAHCLTEKLLVYATGRTLSPTDRPHIDRKPFAGERGEDEVDVAQSTK